MIGDEPDGDDDHVLNTGVMEPKQLSDIRLEPGNVGGPLRLCQARRYRSVWAPSLTRRAVSRNCPAAALPRAIERGNAVGGEDGFRQRAPSLQARGQSLAQQSRQRFDESRVVVKDAQLVKPHAGLVERRSSSGNVFSILPATGIRAVGGGYQKHIAHAVGTHGGNGVFEKRVPVAVAESTGKSMA